MTSNTKSFEQDVLKANVPVLVDFYATWCGPCKMLTPVLEDVAQQFAGRAKVVKVDIDDSPELAQRYGISAVPTLMVFKDGQKVQQVMGYQSPKQLGALLNEAIAAGPAACGCSCTH